MRRNLYIYGCACLSLVVLAALIFPQSGPVTRASAQEGSKRWVIVYHQQNSLPGDADRSVEQAGGSITKASSGSRRDRRRVK